jgi:formamidopyrimidine-DNA glycosylase
MPELPEVETIRSQLSNYLPFEISKTIYSEKITNIIKQKDFNLTKDEIINIERIGKFLIFYFKKPDHYLISHLGMSGSWQISEQYPVQNHAHLILQGSNYYISYVDPRRFGHLYFLNAKNFSKKLNTFPIDITHIDFTVEYIYKVFQSHPQTILKPFLLDQKYFSGIGNYIASEVCARAGFRPDRKIDSLKKDASVKIWNAISDVINGAIQTSGTTFSGGYRDAFGKKGDGLSNLVVFYQETCQLCKKTKVVKTVLAGRGTYHCPTCQK